MFNRPILFCLLFILFGWTTFGEEYAKSDILNANDFRQPPRGYGEVPFWWWTGEKLNAERLIHQLNELHKKGISGVQINYAHDDSQGWPTYPNDPEIFTDSWWTVFDQVAHACRERQMGIGLSGYTIDWQGSPTNLYARMIYSDPQINSRTIRVAAKKELKKEEILNEIVTSDPNQTCIGIIAYPKSENGEIQWSAPKQLLDSVKKNHLVWKADTEVVVWFYQADRISNTLNPLHPDSGNRIIEKFFQPFEDRTVGKNKHVSAEESGINYFFQDELRLGTGNLVWHDDLPLEFKKRKGYELWEALPAMFGTDCGNRTEKYRLDFMDVRVRLAEERYFIPIFDWHHSRNMIYGCDSAGRGRNPNEFGDYFSAVRWYTAPGHDTPGGQADFIKNKVSSSIAHFYKRPRVWLEGYHSFGWGATPEQLLFATNENFLFGANLLNLHGLYYTTYGSFWEWAPPCYHFRMPWWDHFDTFLKYFERLSFAMTRGVQQTDIVILYPVTPGQAAVPQNNAADTAFQAASTIFAAGRDILFIDDDSLARSKVEKGRLNIADGSPHILIIPAMKAIRWTSLQKTLEFYRSGGTVLALGELPSSSDHAGRNDSDLDKAVLEIFGNGDLRQKEFSINENSSGGRGLVIPYEKGQKLPSMATLQNVLKNEPFDVYNYQDKKPLKYHHRRSENQDIYMVMGAKKGVPVTFTSRGKVELWNCWSGLHHEITTAIQPKTGTLSGTTTIQWPFDEKEAGLIVFQRHEKPSIPLTFLETNISEIIQLKKDPNNHFTISGFTDQKGPWFVRFESEDKRYEITGTMNSPQTTLPITDDWDFEIIPTMDNRYGDFRLPIEEQMLGPEAQLFDYKETMSNQKTDIPKFDQEKVLNGFGQKFWKLGPLPNTVDIKVLDKELAQLTQIDPEKPIRIGHDEYRWTPYSFSWRFGIEGNPGHQGYHGLKEKLDNRFIGLGAEGQALNETTFIPEKQGSIYYLWTTATVTLNDKLKENKSTVTIHSEENKPDALYIGGKEIKQENQIQLITGTNPTPLLLRYNHAGRYAFCLTAPVTQTNKTELKRTPLSMKWYDLPGLLDFDVYGDRTKPTCWFRFTAPGGLKSFSVQARGNLEFYVNSNKISDTNIDIKKFTPKTTSEYGLFFHGCHYYQVTLPNVSKTAIDIVIKAQPWSGQYGGNLIAAPIRLQGGIGHMVLGNWNMMGALSTYSGMIRYIKEIDLTREQLQNRVTLDLGLVSASCQIAVNGKTIGNLVAAPWQIVLNDALSPGKNRLEVTVANTLSNFYSTIPSRYKGNTPSGILGHVQLIFAKPVNNN